MNPFLIMAWGIVVGLVMFFISATVYPLLGLPPMWLIGGAFVSIVYALCRYWVGEKR